MPTGLFQGKSITSPSNPYFTQITHKSQFIGFNEVTDCLPAAISLVIVILTTPGTGVKIE